MSLLRPVTPRQYVGKGLSWVVGEGGEGAADTLLESWPWWLVQHLATEHRCPLAPCTLATRQRVLHCYLLEGHKVLFRSALALLKTFHKQVPSSSNSPSIFE